MVTVKEASAIHFAQTEAKMDYPLSAISQDGKVQSLPIFFIIFSMTSALPLFFVGGAWEQKVPVWPYLVEWSFLSPLLLCILAAILTAICTDLGTNVSLLAEKILGKQGALLVHLAFIGVLLFPIADLALQGKDVLIQLLGVSQIYEYIFGVLLIVLFAVPALFGLGAFVGISLFWLPIFTFMLTWLTTTQFGDIAWPDLRGTSSIHFSQWLAFQNDLTSKMILLVFYTANVGRFTGESGTAGRVAFLGLMLPCLILIFFAALLKVIGAEVSLLTLFLQNNYFYIAVLYAVMIGLLIADKAFYTASFALCVLFRSQARRRWVYAYAVAVATLTFYEAVYERLVLGDFILRLMSPILAILITSFFLYSMTIKGKSATPAVRWTALIPLVAAVGLNFVLPYDPFLQGLSLGIVFPFFMYPFRYQEKKDPLAKFKKDKEPEKKLKNIF